MWVGATSFMSSQSFSQLKTVHLQYNSIKITKQCYDVIVKSVCIRGSSCLYYATFWMNMGTYSVSLDIQSKCGKKFAPEKSSEHGHFPHSRQVLWFIRLNLFLCFYFFGLEGLFIDVQRQTVFHSNINNKYLSFLLIGIFL